MRILPAGTAVGVIEYQLDGRCADRFATGRAIEDNVRHRLAAEVLGRALAHDPAYRIDDIDFAAAIGSDDTDEIVGNRTVVRSTNDLKPASLIFPDAWRAKIQDASAPIQKPLAAAKTLQIRRIHMFYVFFMANLKVDFA